MPPPSPPPLPPPPSPPPEFATCCQYTGDAGGITPVNKMLISSCFKTYTKPQAPWMLISADAYRLSQMNFDTEAHCMAYRACAVSTYKSTNYYKTDFVNLFEQCAGVQNMTMFTPHKQHLNDPGYVEGIYGAPGSTTLAIGGNLLSLGSTVATLAPGTGTCGNLVLPNNNAGSNTAGEDSFAELYWQKGSGSYAWTSTYNVKYGGFTVYMNTGVLPAFEWSAIRPYKTPMDQTFGAIYMFVIMFSLFFVATVVIVACMCRTGGAKPSMSYREMTPGSVGKGSGNLPPPDTEMASAEKL